MKIFSDLDALKKVELIAKPTRYSRLCFFNRTQKMRLFGNSDIRLVMILLVSALLVTWILPLGMLFAQDDEEEELLEELTGEEVEEEGSVEVLGFTEEDSPILNNKFLIAVIALIVAAIGGLFLSFVIKGRT